MSERILVLLLLVLNYLLVAEGETADEDLATLMSLASTWKNTPPDWVGSDPCEEWEGIKCKNAHVTSITLASTGLAGQLSGDIGSLSELETLDLSYNKELTGPLPQSMGELTKLSTLILVGCNFNGPIPDTIGNLQELLYLSLNSNSFSGPIPPSIGNLSKLYWLDLAENELRGSIPVSSGDISGLDKLHHAKHFHLGKNKLSGTIHPQLFSSEMALIHLLLESNELEGHIPSTLALVKSLEVVRLDNNSFNGSVPSNIKNLTNVRDLVPARPYWNECPQLPVNFKAFSCDSYVATVVSRYYLTQLALVFHGRKMQRTQLQGQVPTSLFELANLQTVVLKDNKINGTLDVGSSYSNRLRLVDLETNSIEIFKQNDAVPNVKIMSASFSDLDNITYYSTLEEYLMRSFKSHFEPVDSVLLSHPRKDSTQYLKLNLQVFPSGQDHFNRTGTLSIGFMLSNQTFKPPTDFGPFYFLADRYEHFGNYEGLTESGKTVNIGIIIGAAVGGLVLLVLLVLAGLYAFRQKKRAEKAIGQSNPFRRWDTVDDKSASPQLKEAKMFSFEDLKKYTKNFSPANDIGSGGFGKVYKGTLPNGQVIAIKRAQKDSMQGKLEFKAEIELLSRVHHKNLVSLLGFCFDQGEQMLVYEYVLNGSLKEALSGKSGIRLDWIRRLKVALGTARGLAYLHELVNPPIIHRDIKSNNILLDDRLNAKVADFGLSKSMVDSEKDHVTTQVKGTMGYLDPEYYMSQQLTEKSDVYSFGVLMLELISARRPLERGKYIVKEFRNALDRTKGLYGLHEYIDPAIGSSSTTLVGFDKFVNLTLKCVEESGEGRPKMSEVVSEIENILKSAGANPTEESPSISSSYEEVSRGSSSHPYNSNDTFDLSAGFPYPKVDAS
ncbi:unnamed protein product [Sphenostylis stenocarpa]|uniref:non-specific serine/threonine protein kinase n=1 Tax=Sphenostylis stenocarpa TaxID=92480 RepID=A0AA86VGD3_9FABA|nr:unnamed protein product [Sphenostylis stenocarpa]